MKNEEERRGVGRGGEKEAQLTPRQLMDYMSVRVRALIAEGYFEKVWLDAEASERAVALICQGLLTMYSRNPSCLDIPYISQSAADDWVQAATHIPHLYGLPTDGLRHVGWGLVGERLRRMPPDTKKLSDGLKRAELIQDERYPDVYRLTRIINDGARNSRGRLIPEKPGVALSVSEESVPEGYQLERGLPLFYTISQSHAERITFAIENARRRGAEFVICIPTCPCDPIQAATDGYVVEYTGGPLIDGVSWTALNTVDGLAVLLPQLLERVPDLRVKLVFMFGDFEYASGSTRTMTEDDFFEMLTRNQNSLREYLWDVLRMDERVSVEISGVMERGGGEVAWDNRRVEAAAQIDAYFSQGESEREISALVEARRAIYETLRGQTLTVAELYACLKRDAVDYCVADMIMRESDGATGRSSIILAGDSAPMHRLAARITDSILLLVNGGYQGSV